jgi:iron(III) transport system substrate-binding protein
MSISAIAAKRSTRARTAGTLVTQSLAVAATLGAVLFSGLSHAQANLDALIKAAKAEGEVLAYWAPTENVAKRSGDAFTAKYGIKTSFIRFPGDGGIQRFGTEAEANTFAADILLNSGTNSFRFAEEAIKKGWLEPVGSAGIPVIASGEFPAKFNRGATALLQLAPWQMTFNTDKIKPADFPKDWPDLLNPKWKGQILFANPRCCSVFQEFWKAMLDKYGEKFLSDLAAQTGRQYPSGVPAVQGLAAGEGAITLPTIVPQVQAVKSKGAPVDSIMPAYTTGIELHLLLTHRAKAKRPNAARLYANFLLSPEGNAVLNGDPGGFTMYDTAKLPAQYVPADMEAVKHVDRMGKLLGFPN